VCAGQTYEGQADDGLDAGHVRDAGCLRGFGGGWKVSPRRLYSIQYNPGVVVAFRDLSVEGGC